MFVAVADYGVKLAFVIGFTVIFGMVLLLPLTLDLVYSQRRRKPGEGPRGTTGLSRTLMALAVLTVIGFALGYLLIEDPYSNSNKIAGDIIVALTTTLAAIVAFYFGSKTALESASQASTSNGAAPAITIVSPRDGETYKVGEEVIASYSATGNFASLVGTVTSGAKVVGTVAIGGKVSTSEEGDYTLSVHARDAQGHELAMKSVHYSIRTSNTQT